MLPSCQKSFSAMCPVHEIREQTASVLELRAAGGECREGIAASPAFGGEWNVFCDCFSYPTSLSSAGSASCLSSTGSASCLSLHLVAIDHAVPQVA